MAGAYVVSGKFDQMRTNEPFSAIVSAFTDLVDIARNQEVASDISAETMFPHILDSEDVRLLRYLISNLYMKDESDSDDLLGGSKEKERLTSCCCRFLRNMASYTNPVVLHLDDIQWSDESSLVLTKALINDPDSKNILLVCTFRDQEVMNANVRDFLDSDFPIPVTDIPLNNLDVQDINKMVADLLNTSERYSESLAEVVMRKTMGNPYFVVRYLESLEADGLLKKVSSSNWEWDVDRIQSETNVSSNVADLVTKKIQRLPLDLQLLLKLAACLGFEFDRSLLDAFVLSKSDLTAMGDSQKPPVGNIESDNKKISNLLAMATDEGLIQKITECKYKFAHDRIQQCLYDMIPDGNQKESMHLQIGELVWKMAKSSRDPQDWMVFAAANHLNQVGHSSLCGTMSCKRVAQLNLEAAKLSKKKAALVPVVRFLLIGLGLLEGSNQWSEYYDLSLSLTTMLAEVEFTKGKISRCKRLITEILGNARSLQDKIPAYYILIDCIGTEGSLREAMDLALSTLHQLGERFPKKTGLLHVAWELAKTKRLLRGKTDEKLLNLPMMTDERKIARLHLATVISVYAPLLGEQKQMTVIYLRMIQVCVRGGNSYLSPTVFSMYAIAEASLGNTQSATRFAELCLKMVEKMGRRQCGVLPISVAHGVLHWKAPLRACLEPLNRCVEDGIAWGDQKGTLYALQLYFTAAFQCGEPLGKLEGIMRSYCEQKQRFAFVEEGLLLALMVSRPKWQAVLNLQGNAADSSILSGEAMEEEEFARQASETEQYFIIVNWRVMQLQVAYLFGNYELALKTSKELETHERLFYFHYINYSYLFYSSLAYIATADLTGERQYKIKANKLIIKLEKLNTVNSRPLVQLLRAEYRGLNSTNNERIEIYYDAAIATARRAMLPNLEALANERAWLAASAKNIPQKNYLSRAIQLYAQWGATGKVDYLQKHAASVPNTKSSIQTSHKNKQQNYYATPPSCEIMGPVWAS